MCIVLPLILTCCKPQHTTCFEVWSLNHIKYLCNKKCNLPITLNALNFEDGYIILTMQASCVSIPFILVMRCGFTLMTTSSLKIIALCSEKPREFVESLCPEKIDIWCGILRKKIVGSFFFETTFNDSRFYRKFECRRQITLISTGYCCSHYRLFEEVFQYTNHLEKSIASSQHWFIIIWFLCVGLCERQSFHP